MSFENPVDRPREREKNPEEEQIFACAIEEVNKQLIRLGLPPVSLSADQIHIVNPGHKDAPEEMHYNAKTKQIEIKDRPRSKVAFLRGIVHELVHMASYQSQEQTEEGVDVLRVGFQSKQENRQGEIVSSWRFLNEGLTEEFAKRTVLGMGEHPLFAQEIKNAEKWRWLRWPFSLKKPTGDLVTIEPPMSWYPFLLNSRPGLRDAGAVYQKERLLTKQLIQKIFTNNQTMFKNLQEVEDMFYRAMFTGEKDQVIELIESTVGPEVMRTLIALE